MASKNKIHDGEKALIDMGCYVASPINLCVLLTPNEQVVLNVIRHCKNLVKKSKILVKLLKFLFQHIQN